MSATSPTKTLALFVGLAAVWGVGFAAIEIGLTAFPPVLFAALRYDLAGLLLFAFVLWRAWRGSFRWLPTDREEWVLVGLGGLLLVGVRCALLVLGQSHVSGSVAAVVLSLTPVVTPVFALALLPDERIDRSGIVGLALGLVGVVVVANPAGTTSSETLVGVGLLFASAASFALGTVVTRRLETDLPTLPAQAWMMVLGALVLHALDAVRSGQLYGSFEAIEPTASALVALGYLVVVAGLLGFVAYFALIDRIGPTETSLVNYAVAPFGAVAGWLLLGESVTVRTIAGFAVIVAGLLVLKHEEFGARLRSGRTADRDAADSTGPAPLRGD